MPERRADLEVRVIGDDLLVLDRRHGKIHTFNHSAGLVWQHCDGRSSIEDIIVRVSEVYGIPGAAVRDDVVAAVEKFVELGLLAPKQVRHEG